MNIDVIDMLGRLNIDGRPASGGAEANFSCPFHQDERPSAYMNMESSAWFCWSCKNRGKNAISFVAKVQVISYTEAELWLHELYGFEEGGGSVAAEVEKMFANPEPTAPFQAPGVSWLETFSVDWQQPPDAIRYLINRGLSATTLREWGFGYDLISDRPVFPVHDFDGRLIGFKGRAHRPSQEPRYLVLGDRSKVRYGFVPYDPSHVVFGLHRARPGEIVICEGELNAIRLHQAGHEGAVAIGMSYFSEHHARLIIRKARSVVVFGDSDDAGNIAMHDMVKALEPHVPVRRVPHHEGDPMDMTDQQSLGLIAAARPALVTQIESQ